jgi:hypothetical protein
MEYRLFSEVFKKVGRQDSYPTILNLLRSTATQTGVSVRA